MGQDAESTGDQTIDYTTKYYALLELAPTEIANKIDDKLNWDGTSTGQERYQQAFRFLKRRADEMHGMHLGGQITKAGGGADPSPMQIGSMEQQSEEVRPTVEGEATSAEQALLDLAQ